MPFRALNSKEEAIERTTVEVELYLTPELLLKVVYLYLYKSWVGWLVGEWVNRQFNRQLQ